MKLMSRHYGMKKDQVHKFDWDFVHEIKGKLDKVKVQGKYQYCYSHYLDHHAAEFRHFCTFRLYAPKRVINKFLTEEPKLVKKLHYFPFNRDAELKGSPKPLDDMTFKQLADIYYIPEDEMEQAFSVWHAAALLKDMMLMLWDDGSETHRRNQVHYALNTLGMEQEETITYNEEGHYRKRNFPQEDKP